MTDFRALCAKLLDELEYQTNWSTAESLKAEARAALADGPAAPAPPAAGEVAELVTELQSMATDADRRCRFSNAERLTRAAEQLQRQALVPVPDAERPWEREGWCDELGRCWWGRPDTGDWSADWTLATPEAIAEFCEFSPQTVCLPAHALPLPEVGE